MFAALWGALAVGWKIFRGGGLDTIGQVLTQFKTMEGQVDMAALQAASATVRAQTDLLIAEQGHWITRSVRPLMALPFIIYNFKLVAYDKVAGAVWPWLPGLTTDDISDRLFQVEMTIVGFYFTGLTVETVVKLVKRG